MPAFIELIFGLGWDLAFTFLLLFFMAENFPFLPMSLEEAGKKGWSELDVIIISGDAYVDHPSFGPALIGRLLESKGYRVGIIAQPKWNSIEDFKN